MNIEDLKIHIIIFFFYLATAFIIFRKAFEHSGFLLNTFTWPLTIDNFIEVKGLLPYIWNEGLGIESNPVVISYHQPFIIISNMLNFDLVTMFRIELLFTYAFIGFGMYLLVFYLLKTEITSINKRDLFIVAFLSGLMYLFFPSYTISRFDRFAVVISYVFPPYIILLFLLSIKEKKLSFAAISGILLKLGVDHEQRFIIFIPLLLLSYLIFNFIFNIIKIKNLHYKHIFMNIRLLFLPFLIFSIVFFLSKIDFILSFFVEKGERTITILSSDLINVRFLNATLLNLARGLGDLNSHILYQNPPINPTFVIISSMILIILAYLSLIIIQKKDLSLNIIFFSIVAIISTFLFSNYFSGFRQWIILDSPMNYFIGRAFSSEKFQFFIGFSLSILLGHSLIKIFKTLRKLRFSKAIIPFFTFLILISISLQSWPLLTGNINGALGVSDIPSEYNSANKWLDHQIGNFKVLWIPEFYQNFQPSWRSGYSGAWGIVRHGSSKPTYHTDNMPFNYFYDYNLGLHHSKIASNNIDNLGETLAFIGIKYLVIHDDVNYARQIVASMLKNLDEDEDFKIVYQEGIITIFENKKYSGRIQCNDVFIGLTGGLSQLDKIHNITETCSSGFIDYSMGDRILSESNILYSTIHKNWLDFGFFSIPKNYYIIPSYHTNHYDSQGKNWSKAYLSDPHHGLWTPFIHKIAEHNWEFSYKLDYGYIFASQKDTLTIPIEIKKSGNYTLFGRLLKSDNSGEINFSIGDTSRILDTKEYSFNEFLWEELLHVNINSGNYNLKIENIYGDNAINILMFIPNEVINIIKDKTLDSLSEKTIFYSIDPENIEYDSHGYGSFNINIIDPSSYKIAITSKSKENNNTTVLVNNDSLYLKKSKIDPYYYSDVTYLNEENIKFNIKSFENMISSPSFEIVNSNWSIPKTGFNIKYDPLVKKEGHFSLKVTTDIEKSGSWSWIKQEIDLKPNSEYLIQTTMKIQNVKQSHIPIDIYNSSLNSWKRLLLIPSGVDGTSDWREYTKSFTTGSNHTKIRIYLNSGWVLNSTMGPATTWFDDIRVIEKDSIITPSKIIIYKSKQKETLNDIFKWNHSRSNIISVKKINPTEYLVKVNTTTPFFLSFAESYDPLWIASIDEKEYNSIPFCSVINGFFINKTGTYNVILKYGSQHIYGNGYILSATTISISFIFFCYEILKDNTKIKKIKQKIKHYYKMNI